MRIVDPDTQQEIEVPPYATVEEALKHERKRRAGELITVRVFPDWTVRFPLWWDESVISRKEIETLVGTELRQKLEVWVAEWEKGSASSANGWYPDHWVSTGDELVDAIQEQLYAIAHVQRGF